MTAADISDDSIICRYVELVDDLDLPLCKYRC